MRPSLALASVGLCLIVLTAGTARSNAQYAAQLYPYCALDSANGATTCYYGSRQECGRSCIRNPWYLGAERRGRLAPARIEPILRQHPAARHPARAQSSEGGAQFNDRSSRVTRQRAPSLGGNSIPNWPSLGTRHL